MAFAFGLAAASLFPVILLGIFFKRANKQGAIAGMLTGLFFTYGYIEFYKGLFLKWAGSPLTAPPPERIQHLVEQIRIPREIKSH